MRSFISSLVLVSLSFVGRAALGDCSNGHCHKDWRPVHDAAAAVVSDAKEAVQATKNAVHAVLGNTAVEHVCCRPWHGHRLGLCHCRCS